MIKHIKIKSTDKPAQIRKELNKEGWISAFYWTKHGVNVDKVRSLAKKGEINARVLDNFGSTTYYYHESEIAKLKSDGKC